MVGGNSVPTEQGIGVGDTVEDMQAVYGSPARTEEVPVNPGQLVWIYEAEGGSLGFVVDNGVITEVWAGSVDASDIEPCA